MPRSPRHGGAGTMVRPADPGRLPSPGPRESPEMPNGDAVGTRLDADRKDLLDLSLRNPLLNYRPRARGLEIVGEAPPEVFRLLVTEGRAMSFLHDPEADDEPPAPQAQEPAALGSP